MHNLIHFSECPLSKIHPTLQIGTEEGRGFKPSGLWVSIDDSWREWCEGEKFALDQFNYAARVFLKLNANILWVTGETSLRVFDQEWNDGPKKWSIYAIDWRKVASKYDGIVIAPHIWECRLDLMWYSTWDCASGCIWNPDCVESFVTEEMNVCAA